MPTPKLQKTVKNMDSKVVRNIFKNGKEDVKQIKGTSITLRDDECLYNFNGRALNVKLPVVAYTKLQDTGLFNFTPCDKDNLYTLNDIMLKCRPYVDTRLSYIFEDIQLFKQFILESYLYKLETDNGILKSKYNSTVQACKWFKVKYNELAHMKDNNKYADLRKALNHCKKLIYAISGTRINVLTQKLIDQGCLKFHNVKGNKIPSSEVDIAFRCLCIMKRQVYLVSKLPKRSNKRIFDYNILDFRN